MASTLRITLGSRSFTVYPLPQGRAVAATRIVVRGISAWAINEAGKVFSNRVSALREKRFGARGFDLKLLSDDDVTAIDLLHLVDAATAKALRDEARYHRDFKSHARWLRNCADDLIQAGIKLPKDWEARIDSAARKDATRRAQARKKVGK